MKYKKLLIAVVLLVIALVLLIFQTRSNLDFD